MALQTRSEAQERYTWNFKDIFESDEAWEEAYAKAEAALGEIPAREVRWENRRSA